MLSNNPTIQEVYDHILISIREQKEASVEAPTFDGEAICAYRGERNLKCVVGHCIPDENYHPKMEGHNVLSLVNISEFPSSLSWMKEFDMVNFLSLMQTLHDKTLRYYGIKQWELYMRQVAFKRGLKYEPPKEGL